MTALLLQWQKNMLETPSGKLSFDHPQGEHNDSAIAELRTAIAHLAAAIELLGRPRA
jgi:hypothetical protein